MKNSKYTPSNFDEHEPLHGHRERFFNRLENEVHGSRKNANWIKTAVSILIIIGIGTIFTLINDSMNNDKLEVAANKEKKEFPLKDAEHYYQQSYSDQFTLITKNYTDRESIEMIENSERLILQLQEKYTLLEGEFRNTADERVAIAMILNYKSRIKILETLLKKLEYVKQLKQQTHEKLNA